MVEVILGLTLFVKRHDLLDAGDLYGVNLLDVYFQCTCRMYRCETANALLVCTVYIHCGNAL